jgi:hypothetical protein
MMENVQTPRGWKFGGQIGLNRNSGFAFNQKVSKMPKYEIVRAALLMFITNGN